MIKPKDNYIMLSDSIINTNSLIIHLLKFQHAKYHGLAVSALAIPKFGVSVDSAP